ncbi:MAG: DUF4834 family protein [Muribaculaceae bacterium]|nr:DUF4834 family protein [Muribaculaceae bacterium]
MHILFFVGIFALLIIFVVLMAVGNIIRSIFSVFSFRRKNNTRESGSNNNNRTYTSYEKRTKVFGPNEGEYVDFEEIKDKE